MMKIPYDVIQKGKKVNNDKHKGKKHSKNFTELFKLHFSILE